MMLHPLRARIECMYILHIVLQVKASGCVPSGSFISLFPALPLGCSPCGSFGMGYRYGGILRGYVSVIFVKNYIAACHY